ncbi:MAG: hypothetical protein IPK11_13560 [Ignavibacteria bacterium]|jgi:hypothetical protein|nr:hypothetical protein [Ignavibacteria bacterium]
MAQEMPKRMFSASDDALLSRAVNMQQAAVTYQTQLADYGFTAAMITALDTAIEEAIVFPTDEIKLLEITEATQLADAKEEELREAIRAIVTRAILVWGEKSVRVAQFRAETLSKQTREILRGTAGRVVDMANRYATELATKGVTPAMIAAVTTASDELKTAISNLMDAEDSRRDASEERVSKLNGIYEMLQELSVAGKNAFADDPVAYYEFVIWGNEEGGASTPPAAVTNVSLVNSIISWTAAPTATSYRVAISTESNQGNWTEIYSGSNTQAPVPMPLTGGIHVRVQGHNAAGYGEAVIITQVVSIAVPSNFYYASGALHWSQVDWANSYNVEESTDENNWNLVWNQNTDSMPYTPQPGMWYFRLRAGYGTVYSAYTPTLSIDGDNIGG